MGLDFCIFLTTWKKSKKFDIHIADERWGERWPGRQKTDVLLIQHTPCISNTPSRPLFFFWRACLQIASSLFPPPPTFFSFWVLVLNPRSHMYAMLCYSIVIFYLLFGWLVIRFAPLARTHIHSPVANHYAFIITLSKGQW